MWKFVDLCFPGGIQICFRHTFRKIQDGILVCWKIELPSPVDIANSELENVFRLPKRHRYYRSDNLYRLSALNVCHAASVWELVLNWDTVVLYLWFFNMFRYGSIPKEHLNLLYVLNMECVAIFCISIPNWFLNCIITAVLQSVRKFDGSLVISISYFTISSFTLVTHVINPMECSLFSSSYTCLAIVSAGIWYRRFI